MLTMATRSDHVLIVDVMLLRRALFAHFLKDWSAAENVELLALQPSEAHESLLEGVGCRMVIFNAGVASCANAGTLAEITVLRTLAPSAALVVVADNEQPDDVAAVIQSGAKGYLSNHSAPELTLRVLSFLLQGGTYFPPSVIQHAPFPDRPAVKTGGQPASADAPASASAASLSTTAILSSVLPDFSHRQMAILERLRRGEPNKMIGRALDLPESTVKVHVREIMRKLSVSNRTQIVVALSKMGAASPERLGLHHTFREDWRNEQPANGTRTAHAPPMCPADPAPESQISYGSKSDMSTLNVPFQSLTQKISKAN